MQSSVDSELLAERDKLRKARDVGKSEWREWAIRTKILKAQLDAMQDGPVKVGRILGNRPSTSSVVNGSDNDYRTR